MTSGNQFSKSPLNSQLTFKEKLGFGAGDFGFGLFWTSTNLYLLYYYTDVLGISNKTAGFIFMIAMIWDAISDPLAGYLTSKTRSRWGRYRPWLLFGAIPLGISFIIMFYKPALTSQYLVLYTLAAHVVFRTCYTALSVPYGALMADLTQDSTERSSLAFLRMIFAASAGIIVAYSTLSLAQLLGNGDTGKGLFLVAAIYASVATLFFLVTFFSVREIPESVELDDKKQSLSLPSIVAMLRSNSAFWLLFAATVVSVCATTLGDKMSIYYIIYAIGDKDAVGSVMAIIGISTAFSLPVWALSLKRFQKRTIWLTGAAISSLSAMALYFTPVATTYDALPFFVVGAFAKGAMFLSFWAALPDTVEYGQWRSGVRASGAIFGLMTFAQKTALGIAMGLVGLLLQFIGYQANTIQSLATINHLKELMTLVPAVSLLGAIGIFWYYPLDRNTHERLVKSLHRRTNTRTKFRE